MFHVHIPESLRQHMGDVMSTSRLCYYEVKINKDIDFVKYRVLWSRELTINTNYPHTGIYDHLNFEERIFHSLLQITYIQSVGY